MTVGSPESTAPPPPVVAKTASSQGAPLVGTPSCVVAPMGVPQRQFTVDEYHRMIADGYFAHDEAFELLEGVIVRKMSRDPLHDSSLSSARRVLDARVPAGWHSWVQYA